MRLDFDDKSFVEIKLGSPGKVAIILGAKKKDNALELEVNACEITISQFAEMVHDLGVELPKPIKQNKNNNVE